MSKTPYRLLLGDQYASVYAKWARENLYGARKTIVKIPQPVQQRINNKE